MRDLCRASADVVIDRTRARHGLGKFLLRHAPIWRGGENWTLKHDAWMRAESFDDKALEATFAHYRATLEAREAAVEAIEAELAAWWSRPLFAEAVTRLAAYRAVTEMGALHLASEVCDWRRFPTAASFMAFTGLTPSEHSSGERVRRGHITHAGSVHVRTQLVEPAWAYKSRPGLGVGLRRRQEGVPPETLARAWRAQLRLSGRFRRLDEREGNRPVVVTAIARELAGFICAEMTA